MLNCWLKRPDFDHNVSSLFSDVQTIFIVGLVYYGIYTFASLFMTYGSCTVSKWHMSTHSCSLFHAHSFWFCIPCLSLFSLSLFFIPCSSILILYSMLLLFFFFYSMLIHSYSYSLFTYSYFLFHAYLFSYSVPCSPVLIFYSMLTYFLLFIPCSLILTFYSMITHYYCLSHANLFFSFSLLFLSNLFYLSFKCKP